MRTFLLSLTVCKYVRSPNKFSIMMETKKSNVFTLKTLRKQLGMSQSTFAKALGVRRSTISDWERGASKPTLSIDQVKRLDVVLKQANKTFADLPDDIAG